MNLGIDVDDTIMRAPELFRVLTEGAKSEGWKVHVITTRPRTEQDRRRTIVDLESSGVKYDFLHHLPKREGEVDDCPHETLDDYHKFVWQKVKYCNKHKIDVFFDDDERVVELFKMFAPEVQVFRVCKHDIGL